MINVENAVQNADDTEDAHDAHDADDVDVKQVNKPSPSPSPSPSTKTHKFFKSAIHSDMLYDFIKKISYKMPNSEYYLIDLNAYKKSSLLFGTEIGFVAWTVLQWFVALLLQGKTGVPHEKNVL